MRKQAFALLTPYMYVYPTTGYAGVGLEETGKLGSEGKS